jgi:hypothetical protein
MAAIQQFHLMSQAPFIGASSNGPGRNGTKYTSPLEQQLRADRLSTSASLSPSLPPPPPTAPPPYFYPNQAIQSEIPHVYPPISTFISAESRPHGSGDISVRPGIRPKNPAASSQRFSQSPPFPTPDTTILPSWQNVSSAPTDTDPTAQGSYVIGAETIAVLRDIVELRNKVVAKRLHIKNDLRDMDYKRQRAAKAQEEFIAASTAHMAALADPTLYTLSDQLLLKAWEELKSSTSVVKAREVLLGSSEDDLLKLESRLTVKEGEFYEKFRVITQDALMSADNSTAISSSSGSSVSTEPVAREYYSRVKELNLLRERYFNFVSEHRKQGLIRDAQRKENQLTIPPERVFDQAYLLEKEKMIQDYISAKMDMEQKMEVCDRLGVEIRPSNLPAFLDHSNRKERASRIDAGSEAGEGPKLRLPTTNVRSDNRHSILQWLQEHKSAKLKSTEMYWEESRYLPIDSVTPPIDVSDIPEWTDQEAEEYLALPSYNHLQPSSTSDDSTTETDVPRWTQAGKIAANIKVEAFQGEPPKRRYSAPPLHPSPVAPVHLTKGLLHQKEKDAVDLPRKAHLMRIRPESLP